MNHRAFLLVGFGLVASVGLVGFACSSGGGGADAGDDSGTGSEGGADVTNPDSGKPDSGGPTKCATYPTKGACDIVAQDCPMGQECVAVSEDGGLTLKCETASTGSVPKGGKCTSNGQCVAGTECIQGRCAWHCCDMDDSPCGMSQPEGYIGVCNLNLVDNNQKIVGHACTYSADCTPFGLKPCPSGSTCLVQDMSGKATCTQIFMPPGKDQGQPCSAANDCKDGMMCVGGADGGFACSYTCYKGGGTFDAGVAKMDAGLGGCPMGKTCGGGIGGLPMWLGLCK